MLSPVRDDEAMTSAPPGPPGPRSERPLRRSFTPAQKLEHLKAYEAACQTGEGGAYLRAQRLFSSRAERRLATTEMALTIMGKAS